MALDSAVSHTWPPPVWHERCDRVTEPLIYAMLIFCPWAFGITDERMMKPANTVGYALGALLVVKWIIRWRMGYRPVRWAVSGGWVTGWVAVVTVGLLVQVLVSAINARATYDWERTTFVYHECISWLPHSYDSDSTWIAFWNYLAWACFFWAVRDWLLAKSEPEVLAELENLRAGEAPPAVKLPLRFRRLFWVLSINGAVLALEGLVQQASGTSKLLWIRDTFYNRSADKQFGPFPYRSNGAQYLNLIWPAALGFWWALQRWSVLQRSRSTAHHVLLGCVALMIVGPSISLSRGGVLVTGGCIVASAGPLLFNRWRDHSTLERLGAVCLLGLAIAGGLFVNWSALVDRMKYLREGFQQREQMSAIGRKMAAESPWFGTGPETLQPLYQLYKFDTDEYWPGQLHNDWLETQVTFGWVGFGMIVTALTLSIGRWWVRGGVPVSWRLVSFIWVAMTGCLVHARWDLPFQVYSIVLLFLLHCSVLLCFSRR